MADAVGMEGVHCAANGLRAGDFARVRNGTEALLADEREDVGELLRRVEGLFAAESDADDLAFLVPRRPTDELEAVLDRCRAGYVGREQDLDAVQFSCFLGAVAVAREEVVPGNAAPRSLNWGEDPLDIHRPVLLRLGGIVDHDLAEVVRRLERVRGEDPDLDEVVEVPVAIEIADPLRSVGRKGEVVPAGDLEEGLRPHRRLEMHVQLDLREGVGRVFPGILHSRGAYRVARPPRSKESSLDGTNTGTAPQDIALARAP